MRLEHLLSGEVPRKFIFSGAGSPRPSSVQFRYAKKVLSVFLDISREGRKPGAQKSPGTAGEREAGRPTESYSSVG